MPNQGAAEATLDKLERAWSDKHRAAILSWRNKWIYLLAHFRYPPEIRGMIYTANAIESFHRQFRKLTKNQDRLQRRDNGLLKPLCVAAKNIEKKWTIP